MEQKNEPLSCDIGQFEEEVCAEPKMAVLFLAPDTKLREVVGAVSGAGLDMKIGVLVGDEKCVDLKEKYSIEEGTQLVVFEGCEKKAAVNLDEDPEGQMARLKEELEQPEPVFEVEAEPILEAEPEEPVLGAVPPEEVQTGEEED